MKTKIIITFILSVLIFCATTAMAIDPSKLGNVPMITLTSPASQYQSGPMDSVLVIKGKINMGATDYYSVKPLIEAPEQLTIDGQPLTTIAPELGIYKMDIVPQLKSSASAGWTIYLCAMTGSNPNYWQKFQAIGSVTYKSFGMVLVKYQQNGTNEALVAKPGMGMEITKTIGPVKPK
jgi:hypothetical protein